MKKRKAIILYLIVIAIMLSLFTNFIINNLDDIKKITIVKPSYIILLVLLFILFTYSVGMAYNSLFKVMNVNLSQKTAFQLATATGFYNLITPIHGGTLARGIFLKKKFKLPYSEYISVIIVTHILMFFIGSVIGLVSSLLIFAWTGIFGKVLFFIFLTLFFILLLLLIASPSVKSLPKNWTIHTAKIINGWYKLQHSRKAFISSAIFTFLEFLFIALAAYIQFRVFGYEISLASAFFFSAVWNIAMIFSLTPANIGVNETLVVFGMSAIGHNPSIVLAAALLWRVIQICVSVILGLYFSYSLFKKKGGGK